MVTLSNGSSSIQVLGLSHPGFLVSGGKKRTDTRKMKAQLQKWSGNEGFQILLSHRPDFFDLYKKSNIDVIFSGHSHGGQFRIPGIGGLLSPDQGFFPKYDGGRYAEDGSVMYVSRGLGNSLFPIRIFNRPEIIAVTLKADL
jgi:predicted MPP superfamily phosphohydrolase